MSLLIIDVLVKQPTTIFLKLFYGKNLINPLDVASISTSQQFSRDTIEWLKRIKHLHEEVRAKIKKTNQKISSVCQQARQASVLQGRRCGLGSSLK